MTLSPRTLVASCAALIIAALAVTLSLALSAPRLGVAFAAEGDALVVAEVRQPGIALRPGQRIAAFLVDDGSVLADASLLIEEPDLFPTYSLYNAFMVSQSRLAGAAHAGRLAVVTADGRTVPVPASQRTLGDLPAMFWLQLFFGVAGMMTGAVVLAARPSDRAALLYALTGFGYLVFAPAAAVYSTRDLVLDGGIFRWLSIANHFGALLFTGSLVALLWTFPVRLSRLPMVTLVLLATLAIFVADTLQLTDSFAQYQVSVLVLYSTSFLFAAGQWWRTRNAPAERAALRWFLLAIYLATGLFAGMIIIPAAIGAAPPASQGLMFGAFLVMYWGLALGIVRYRLFQLQEWWRTIWWWFLGGIAVALVDVLLLTALALPDNLALATSVAIVGWLYFPLRQWLWLRLGTRRERDISQWLPEVLPLVIETAPATSYETQIRDRWPHALDAVFRPMAIESAPGAIHEPQMLESGLALAVPDLRGTDSHLVLRHPDRGLSLFAQSDARTLDALRELFELALDRLRARDAGARVERERIRRDVHDDIGARLLTLLHTVPEDNRPLVREAIDDLRSLVRALEHDRVPLRDAMDAWQAEARRRTESAGIALHWQSRTLPLDDVRLSARQMANLTRMLREATSNALRHARPTQLWVSVRGDAGFLVLDVENDGQVLPASQWQEGRGRQIMTTRATELGGQVEWQAGENFARVSISVPVAG